MAQKFYNVAKAAEVLGISPAEVNNLREAQQLHGYRDGADWKFKAEEVDELAAKGSESPKDVEDGEEDILVTEQELGLSDPGASGTVIGPPPADLEEVGEETQEADKDGGAGSAVSGFEELEFAFDDSKLDLASGGSDGSGKSGSGSSEIDISADALDDDDLVLGGSSGGSDLRLGGDSGISLIDPTDSGLSLEEPLELGGSSGSLSLSGDSLLASGDDLTDLSSEDSSVSSDFTLTPMDEVLDDDSSQSDSQVIALDTDDAGELDEMPAVLEEESAMDLGDISEMPMEMEEVSEAAPLAASGDTDFGAAAVQDVAAPKPQAAATIALAEEPYTGLNITSLSICVVLLALVGMMMYDVVQNMWSWNGVHSFNSPILDLLSSMLG